MNLIVNFKRSRGKLPQIAILTETCSGLKDLGFCVSFLCRGNMFVTLRNLGQILAGIRRSLNLAIFDWFISKILPKATNHNIDQTKCYQSCSTCYKSCIIAPYFSKCTTQKNSNKLSHSLYENKHA